MENKTKIKILFLDVDGTLVSFNTHQIPASSIEAIRKAHEQGVKIIIATGRCRKIINNLAAIEPYIDGYSCTNGSYNSIDGQEVSCYPIAPDDVRKVIEKAHREQKACIVSGKENVTVQGRDAEFHEVFVEMHNIPLFAGPLPPLDTVLEEGVTELTVFFRKEEGDKIMSELSNCESSRWYPAFMDITAQGVNKGQAVRDVARHLGVPIAETMAIGDGDNDVSMLQAAGIGVAMGNSADDVKDKADYVTDCVDDDGLANALRHFGVITE